MLDRTPDQAKRTNNGVIVMPDETLRICHAGMLSAVTQDGTILWQVDLRSLVREEVHWISSLPTALRTGETLLFQPDHLLLVDRDGSVRRQAYQLPDDNGWARPDDSGGSPNLTESGLLILPSPLGAVYLFRDNQWQEIGYFGYDIVTPAVYPDHSLAIAGYAGKGFCRVSLEGAIQWSTSFRDADLLPTLNQEQIAAVGSLNDGCSAFFTPDGKLIGSYPHAATFAVFPDGGWVALSKQRLARLTYNGKELWGRDICPADSLNWIEQPLVDQEGFIFIRQKDGFLCWDAHGRTAFEVTLPQPPQGLLSIIAPGVLAYAQENELFLGHS
jgi:outer membrane protein assembly factor BamB